MTKFKVSKKEYIRSLEKTNGVEIYSGYKIPDFIQLEGEAVEETHIHVAGMAGDSMYCKTCGATLYKSLPPLPEEIVSEDKNLTTRVETINAIIRYLKARENL